MNPLQMLELIYKGSELAGLPKARHVDIERCYLALTSYLEAQIKREEEAKADVDSKTTESDKQPKVQGQMRP